MTTLISTVSLNNSMAFLPRCLARSYNQRGVLHRLVVRAGCRVAHATRESNATDSLCESMDNALIPAKLRLNRKGRLGLPGRTCGAAQASGSALSAHP